MTLSKPLAALRERKPCRWLGLALSLLVVLQAAMPWLATQAAQMRGVALVEVCTTYGVRTVALDIGSEHAPASSAHGGEQCLLQAVGFGPAPALRSETPLPLAAASIIQRPGVAAPAHDATAQWAARLKHSPPPV
jgi:hypothetical protein